MAAVNHYANSSHLICRFGNRPHTEDVARLQEFRTDAAYRCAYCSFTVCVGCFAEAYKEGKIADPKNQNSNNNNANKVSQDDGSSSAMIAKDTATTNNNNEKTEIVQMQPGTNNFCIFQSQQQRLHMKNSKNAANEQIENPLENRFLASTTNAKVAPIACWPSNIQCPQCFLKGKLELFVSPPFPWLCETWQGENFRNAKATGNKVKSGGAHNNQNNVVYTKHKDEIDRRRKTAKSLRAAKISACFLGIVASIAAPRKLIKTAADEEKERKLRLMMMNHRQHGDDDDEMSSNDSNDNDDDDVLIMSSAPPSPSSFSERNSTTNNSQNNSSGSLKDDPINVSDSDSPLVEKQKKKKENKIAKTQELNNSNENPNQKVYLSDKIHSHYVLNPIELVRFPDTFVPQDSLSNNYNNNINNNSDSNNVMNSNFIHTNNTSANQIMMDENLAGNSRRCREDEEWQLNVPFFCTVPPIRASMFLVRGVYNEMVIRSMKGSNIHSLSRGACCREGHSFAYFLHNMDGLETELIWFGVPHRLEHASAHGAAPLRDSGHMLEDLIPVARVSAPPSALTSVRPQILHVPYGTGFCELRLMQGKKTIGKVGDRESDKENSDSDDEAGRLVLHDRPPLLIVSVLLDTKIKKRKTKMLVALDSDDDNNKKRHADSSSSNDDDDDDDDLDDRDQEINVREEKRKVIIDYDPLVGGCQTQIILPKKNEQRSIFQELNSREINSVGASDFVNPVRCFSRHEASSIRTAVDYLLNGSNVALWGLGSKRHILSAISRTEDLSHFAIHVIDGTQLRDSAASSTGLSLASAIGGGAANNAAASGGGTAQQSSSAAASFSSSTAAAVNRLAERGLFQHIIDRLRVQIANYDRDWEFQFQRREYRVAMRRRQRLLKSLPLAQGVKGLQRRMNNEGGNNSDARTTITSSTAQKVAKCIQNFYFASAAPLVSTPGATAVFQATGFPSLSSIKAAVASSTNLRQQQQQQQQQQHDDNAANGDSDVKFIGEKKAKNNNSNVSFAAAQQQQQQQQPGTPWIHPLLRTPGVQEQKYQKQQEFMQQKQNQGAAHQQHRSSTTTTTKNPQKVWVQRQFEVPESTCIENETITDLLFLDPHTNTAPLPTLPRSQELCLGAIDNQAGRIALGRMSEENIRKIFGGGGSATSALNNKNATASALLAAGSYSLITSVTNSANLALPELFVDSAAVKRNKLSNYRRRLGKEFESDDEQQKDPDRLMILPPATTSTKDTEPLRHLVVIINADWVPSLVLTKIADVLQKQTRPNNSNSNLGAGSGGGRIVVLTCFDDPTFLKRASNASSMSSGVAAGSSSSSAAAAASVSADLNAFRFKLLEVHTMSPYIVESSVLSETFTKFIDATAALADDDEEQEAMVRKQQQTRKRNGKGKNGKNNKNNDDDDDADAQDKDEEDEENMRLLSNAQNKHKQAVGTVPVRIRQMVERAIASLPSNYKPIIYHLAQHQIRVGSLASTNLNTLVDVLEKEGQVVIASKMRSIVLELSSNQLVKYNRSSNIVRFLYPELLVDLTKNKS